MTFSFPALPTRYRWLTLGQTYRYSAAPGKGRDDLRGEQCTALILPRPGTRPANVLVEFTTGERHIVPSGVLKAIKPVPQPCRLCGQRGSHSPGCLLAARKFEAKR